MNEAQFERLMEVLWCVNDSLQQLDKTLNRPAIVAPEIKNEIQRVLQNERRPGGLLCPWEPPGRAG